MAATKQENSELMWEHKYIRRHLKILTNSLSKLATQSGQQTAQSTKLKDQITLYRWSLYDFREAIRRHINLDERILGTTLSTSVESIAGQHEIIKKQLDNAIRLAENATYNRWSRVELNKCASDIKEAVNEICESIGAHIAKEDRLIKPLQKD